MRARLSTFRSLDPVRPDAAEHRPRPAAGSEPNTPLRSPIQSVWVASFSTVAMASFSSVVDTYARDDEQRQPLEGGCGHCVPAVGPKLGPRLGGPPRPLPQPLRTTTLPRPE